MIFAIKSDYYTILKEAVNDRLEQEIGLALILLIIAISSTISFYRDKKRNENHKQNKARKGKKNAKNIHRNSRWSRFFAVSIIGVVIHAVQLGSFAIHARNDLEYEQFIVVEAEYIRNNEPSSRAVRFTRHATLIIEGDKVLVDLPPDWSSKTFPEGRFKVIACYAKDTKLLLDLEIISSSTEDGLREPS